MALPTDAKARKGIPMFSGLVAYFPTALAAVAQLSRIGNDQHNPGEPLGWAKEKSADEKDALVRHLADTANDEAHRDPDGVMAAVKLAWRALANLERMADRGVNIFSVEAKPAPTVTMSDYPIRSTNPADIERYINRLNTGYDGGLLTEPAAPPRRDFTEDGAV